MVRWTQDFIVIDSDTFYLPVAAVNCTDPPEKPGSGTWEWNQELSYATEILYTCGPFGNFQSESGDKYPDLTVHCAWNKSWTPAKLDPCVATSCQVIPFPDEDTGLVYQPEGEDSIDFDSEFNVYNPRIPHKMNFPGAEFCSDNKEIMMIVGVIEKKRKPFDIKFAAEGIDEAFHVKVDVKNEVVQRWSVLNNLTQEVFGEEGEGTSIDYDEPFVIRFC